MSNTVGCFMCEDPMFIDKEGSFPQKIADLKVSTVILNRDWQFFKGAPCWSVESILPNFTI